MSETNRIKDAVRKLADELPDDVTWDEVARRVDEQRAAERQRSDEAAASRVEAADEILERFGIRR